MRLGLLFASILTCGCRQIFGVETPSALASDAARDTLVPSDTGSSDASGQACFTVATLALTACADRVLPPLEAPSDTVFDTSDTALCDAASPAGTCLIATTTLSIAAGAHVSVTGTRPLIVFATQTIAIAGTFDVASHVDGTTGPGANPASCPVGSLPSGGGGGAGGSFGTGGAHGGDGGLLTGGTRGTAAAIIAPATLRGGCPGQSGAGVTGGGAGGGALLLIANDRIDLTDAAVINASGQSGDASPAPTHGGNGGGAGGMIAISAPVIRTSMTTQMFANGGHGGGGSTSAADGNHGIDPTSATSGGSGGGGSSGTGGAGYPTTGVGGTGITQGGGGGGVIELSRQDTIVSGAVSPPAN